MPDNLKLGFKQGSQAGLESLVSSAIVPGTFYLANDTSRLYIGKTNSDGQNIVSPINQSIIRLADCSKLKAQDYATSAYEGQFFYCEAENVLCTVRSNAFVQINAISKLDSITLSSNDNYVTARFKNSLDINGNADTNDLIFEAGNGIDISVTSDTKHITIAEKDMEITYAEDKAIFSNGGAELKVGGALYFDTATGTLNSESLKVSLKKETEANNKYQYVIESTDAKGNASQKGVIDPSIKYGSNSNQEATLDENGTITLNVYSKDDIDDKLKTQFDALDAMIYRGVIETVFDEAAGVLASYNGDIPNSFVSYNNAEVIKNPVHIGDTYKVGTKGIYVKNGEGNPEKIAAGTLMIAKAAEGAQEEMLGKTEEGVWEAWQNNRDYQETDKALKAEGIVWDFVSSSVIDTTYNLKAVGNNTVALKNANTGEQAGSLAFSGDDAITISVTDDNGNASIAVAHKTIDDLESVNSNEGKVVTGISVDNHGHITGIATTTDKTDIKYKNSIENNNTIVNEIAYNNSGNLIALDKFQLSVANQPGNVSVEATSITRDDKIVGANLAFDLVWGSF